MRRRPILIFIAMAIMVVPALALALPRPPGETTYSGSSVTYTVKVQQGLTVPAPVPSAVPSNTVTVPPMTVLSPVPLPLVAGLTFRNQTAADGSPLLCTNVKLLGSTVADLCALNPGGVLTAPGSVNLGGGSTPAVTLCQNPTCSVTVGGQGITVPAGGDSSMTLSWTADQTYLWATGIRDDNGATYDVVSPINPQLNSHRTWFQNNLNSVGATVTVVAKQGGTTLHERSQFFPGLGQILEAMFRTRINGQ